MSPRRVEGGPDEQGAVRLQKALAAAGLGSRRACEELIAAGRVEVNGLVATLGTRADPQRDVIRVDGDRLPTAATWFISRCTSRGACSRRCPTHRVARASVTWCVTGGPACTTSAGSTPTAKGCCW